jgi:hypothetical protein
MTIAFFPLLFTNACQLIQNALNLMKFYEKIKGKKCFFCDYFLSSDSSQIRALNKLREREGERGEENND